jgi:glutamate-5-semialdehyde dehydrogenase
MSKARLFAQQARAAAVDSRRSTVIDRRRVLEALATHLRHYTQDIIQANQLDVAAAHKNNMSSAMIDRLTLTDAGIESMAKAVEQIVAQKEVLGEIVEENLLPSGLKVQRQRIPLGVIAMIFESRPNVVIDAAALAIKSGNAIILKGGKEAHFSNHILSNLVKKSLAPIMSEYMVQLLDDKEDVAQLLTLAGEIDVLIPRGGEKLIRYVYENSKIPVIAHFKGLCHIYVHHDADLAFAKKIIVNSKLDRPGVCNAMESLLLHANLPQDFLRDLLRELAQQGVEIRGCPKTCQLLTNARAASNEDYDTEYLDKILSVKIVDSHQLAIKHIQQHGTHHTEAILAKDSDVIKHFQRDIDASCIIVNASTRFNDGGELGLGAELGISTTKLHAYGPMGAREMTTTRFVVTGHGQIRKRP